MDEMATIRQSGRVPNSHVRKYSVMLRTRTVASLLTLLLSVFLALAQTKTVGQLVADLEHGDESALVELITLGNAGNADAQFNLGGLYLDGKTVRKDIVGAAN